MVAATLNVGRPMAAQDPSPESADRVRGALAVLGPLQPLLAGFNHRNRNQHRGARWWGAFGMLRRGAGRLVGLLEREQRAGARVNKKTTMPKQQQQRRQSRKGGDGEAAAPATATDDAEAMAAWARDVLVPGCYM
jgi:ribonuclease MRP protein subunit RMP1